VKLFLKYSSLCGHGTSMSTFHGIIALSGKNLIKLTVALISLQREKKRGRADKVSI